MKFPLLSFMNKINVTRLVVFLMTVAALSLTVTAQKRDSGLLPETVGVNIEQCGNGPQAAPINCDVSNANAGYIRGNLVASKSHYLEGDFVPIRIIADGLSIGTIYTITIGYDYTKSGKYANDYLGDFDYTEQNPIPNPPYENNPCVDVVGCDLATAIEVAFPNDPQVLAGFDGNILTVADNIDQIEGSLTVVNANNVSFSNLYLLSGSTAGDSTKSITITFTAQATTVVLAYGTHISTRVDWGTDNSAINISGSPYHNYIVSFPGSNQGNRDLQLSADAVIFPASLTIIKEVRTLDSPIPPSTNTTSTFEFDFNLTQNSGITPFMLVDDVVGDGGGAPLSVNATEVFTGLVNFGAANTITVQEADYSPNWQIGFITCVENPGGFPQNDNSTTNPGTRTATIILEEGEIVVCTFRNTQLQPSAAPASVSGRVLDAFGNGISGARLTLTNAQDGFTWTAISNPFGYYTIEGAEIGNFYIMTVGHKRYSFTDDTRTFTLNEDLAGLDFVANP